MKELKTPYKNLNPPLTPEAMKLLRANIDAVGVLQPVLIDEEGNVLDGHHRLEIDPDAPLEVIKGKTDAEKRAIVLFSNGRQLDAKGRKHVLAEMKKTAFAMRAEDPKKWTQAAVAAALGVSQNTVSDWFRVATKGHNIGTDNVSAPDARVSVTEDKKQEIVERIEAGETQTAVASDLGISTKTIHRIVAGETENDSVETSSKNKKNNNRPSTYSAKALEVFSRIQNGEKKTDACASLGISKHEYLRAYRVCQTENSALINAMDSKLIPITNAANLAKKSKAEQDDAVSIAEVKEAEKQIAALSITGKKKWEQVLETLHTTSQCAYSLIHLKLLTKTSIPPDEDNRQSLLRLCDFINRSMSEITKWAKKGCDNVCN